jgi:hypothetical protein
VSCISMSGSLESTEKDRNIDKRMRLSMFHERSERRFENVCKCGDIGPLCIILQ